MRRILDLLLLATIGLVMMACSPGYKIVKQATPNPFLGAKTFVVLPVDFTGLNVGGNSEEEHLAKKEDKQAESFQADKDGLSQLFINELKSDAASEGIGIQAAAGEVATFIIKPMVSFIEPGWYAGIMASPSKVQMTVKITDKDGNELDEIFIEHGTQSGITNPASGQRLRSDGEAIGGITASYIITRVLGEE